MAPVGPVEPVAPVAPNTLPCCWVCFFGKAVESDVSFGVGKSAACVGKSLCDPLRIPAICEKSNVEDKSVTMTRATIAYGWKSFL